MCSPRNQLTNVSRYRTRQAWILFRHSINPSCLVRLERDLCVGWLSSSIAHVATSGNRRRRTRHVLVHPPDRTHVPSIAESSLCLCYPSSDSRNKIGVQTPQSIGESRSMGIATTAAVCFHLAQRDRIPHRILSARTYSVTVQSLIGITNQAPGLRKHPGHTKPAHGFVLGCSEAASERSPGIGLARHAVWRDMLNDPRRFPGWHLLFLCTAPLSFI